MAFEEKKDDWSNKPLTGKHQVTPDGEHVFIGRHKFKRVVLPSHADLHKASQDDGLDALETCDELIVQERDSSETED